MSSSICRLALSSVLCLLAVQAYAETETPHFLGEKTQVSDTGYFTLSWSNPEHKQVIIEKDSSSEFRDPRTLFRGTDDSVFVTGLQDGIYYFRLQSDAETIQPDVLKLTVTHRSLTQSVILFCIGAFVFAASALVILRGVR